jgi:hypothetical protein
MADWLMTTPECLSDDFRAFSQEVGFGGECLVLSTDGGLEPYRHPEWYPRKKLRCQGVKWKEGEPCPDWRTRTNRVVVHIPGYPGEEPATLLGYQAPRIAGV